MKKKYRDINNNKKLTNTELERIGLEPTVLCMQNIRDNQITLSPL
jgi:hypothetical protein